MNKLRYSAIGCALPLMIFVFVSMLGDINSPLFAKGKIQSGHTDLDCASCHQEAPGSYRQQIQANVRYILGWRPEPVHFGFEEVSSDQCMDCHERPNERHPVYRFKEPRFADALTQVDASSCLGCHSEHEDRRAHDRIDFCGACHEDLRLKNDPLDIPHHEVIADKAWDTCLGCHDFHGNHVRKAQIFFEDRHAEAALRDYLANGPSPYGDQRHFEAKKP